MSIITNPDGTTSTVLPNGQVVPNVQPTVGSITPATTPAIGTLPPAASSLYIDPTANPDPNDLSDFSKATSGATIQLPIRGEKQFIPNQVSIPNQSTTPSGGINAFSAQPNSILAAGQTNISRANPNTVTASSFYLKAAKAAFKDYITVRIPHRGFDSSGNPNLNNTATFRFLVNPTTIQVNRETIDQQALTRDGWQFGVWGEGLGRVSMSGTTAGEYFSLGLADEYSYFTKSYRNLMALTSFYESNGYFWEGEQAFSGTLQGVSRKFIKCHQDVLLTVGNFVWSGMFDSFSVHFDAEKPYSATFELSFISWRERFLSTSPYDSNLLDTDTRRGHSYSNYYTTATQQEMQRLQQGTPSMTALPSPNFHMPNTLLSSTAAAAMQATLNWSPAQIAAKVDGS
jgi:hypothetical protein